MRKFYEDKDPHIFEAGRRYHRDGAARALIDSLRPSEGHIPVPPATLAAWRAELPFHGNSTYAQILARDIRFAEEATRRGCAMIVSWAIPA